MSWKNRISDRIVIQTGDGKKYETSWRLGDKKIDYNFSAFEFPNIEGTLVKRQKVKGSKFEINLVFQGDDNIKEANDFEISCRSEKPIILTHPIYGLLTLQVVGLSIDNSAYNVTDVIIDTIETISGAYPKADISIVDKIEESKEELNTAIINATSEVSSTQVSTQNNIVDSYNSSFDILAKLNDEKEALINLTNTAKTAVTNAIFKPAKAIESVINLINFPADVVAGINSIFTVLNNTLTDLLLTDLDIRANKFIYEKNGAALIGTLCLVSARKAAEDFETKTEVLNYIEQLLGAYNGYIEQLDTMQTDRADTPESYVPDFDSISGLDNLFNITISNLFTIAFAAKQERKVLLDADSNVILLTDKYYGLDAADENIDKFISTNNIGISEMLVLNKGREITYYL